MAIKNKLTKLLEYDSNTAFKNYDYYQLQSGNFMFIIHDGGRKGNRYEEEFTPEEMEIVKTIFEIKGDEQ